MTNKKQLTLRQLIQLEKLLVTYVGEVKDTLETDDELFDYINICRSVQNRIYSIYSNNHD